MIHDALYKEINVEDSYWDPAFAYMGLDCHPIVGFGLNGDAGSLELQPVQNGLQSS